MTQLRFFNTNEKINPFKEVPKKSSLFGLTECLGENRSLSNVDIEDFLTFIQIVP